MNSSNATVSQCSNPPWFDTVANSVYNITYFGIGPSYFFLGLFGNVLSLLAFRQQAKLEQAYLYQLFSTVNQLLEVFTFAALVISQFWCSGYLNDGCVWFKTNQGLMWYTAHIASPAINSFLTSAIFLSLSMTWDRILALINPFKYRSMNHKCYQVLAVVLSWSIGIGTSAFDSLRFTLTKEGDVYKMASDQAYLASTVGTTFAQTRNVVRGVGSLALILSNAYLVITFHKRNAQVINLLNTTTSNPDNSSKEHKRKETEKTLAILTIADAVLTSIGMCALIVFYIGNYTAPKFMDCTRRLLSPVLDGTLQVTKIVNFYLVLAISKQFRGIIVGVLPVWMQRCMGAAERTETGLFTASRSVHQ